MSVLRPFKKLARSLFCAASKTGCAVVVACGLDPGDAFLLAWAEKRLGREIVERSQGAQGLDGPRDLLGGPAPAAVRAALDAAGTKAAGIVGREEGSALTNAASGWAVT